MKKTGFTLSELLITLGIAGVVTVLAMPAIQRIMPDNDKGMVVKAYQIVSEINKNILFDSSLYIPCTDNSGTSRPILECDTAPADGQHAAYTGAAKYPHLLSDNMSLSVPYNDNSGTYTFTSSDGIAWTLTASNAANTAYDVVIDVGNPTRKSCTYDKSTCTNPGRFSFTINPHGKIEANDNLTKAYLLNPTSLHDRKADLEKAKSL